MDGHTLSPFNNFGIMHLTVKLWLTSSYINSTTIDQFFDVCAFDKSMVRVETAQDWLACDAIFSAVDPAKTTRG